MNTNIKIFEDDGRLVIEIVKENVGELKTNAIIANILQTLVDASGTESTKLKNLEAPVETPIAPLTENAKELTNTSTPSNCGDVMISIGKMKDNPMTVEELVNKNIGFARWIIEKMENNKNAAIIKQREAIIEYFKFNGIS